MKNDTKNDRERKIDRHRNNDTDRKKDKGTEKPTIKQKINKNSEKKKFKEFCLPGTLSCTIVMVNAVSQLTNSPYNTAEIICGFTRDCCGIFCAKKKTKCFSFFVQVIKPTKLNNIFRDLGKCTLRTK